MKGINEPPDDKPTPEVKNSKDSAAPPPAAAAKDHESDLPIDRGYAWVIVLGCFFSGVLCLGLQRAYGILFVEFLHLYTLPVSIMSVVMAIQSACTSVSALLTQTVMLSLLSERQTVFIGGVCGGAGIILSYFASNLGLLILTQSVLVGAANGMIMGPTQVIVSKYFFKRRSLALACSTLGGNVGSMTMSIFTEFLLDKYGVKGALLILGAVFLNITVFALLLRPLHLNRRRRRKKASEGHLLSDTMEEETQRGRGWSSMDDDTDKLSAVPRRISWASHLWVSNPDLALAANINLDDDDYDDGNENYDHHSHRSRDNHVDGRNAQELQPLHNSDKTATHLNPVSNNGKSNNNNNGNTTTTATAVVPEVDSKAAMAVVTTTDKPTLRTSEKRRSGSSNACARFLSFFDFSLFKQPPFLLILVACSLAFMPAALFGMYLPAMAVDKGVVGQKVALLLTVFGGVGIFSRLAFGYMADKNCIRRAYLMALLLCLSCSAGLFTPFYNTYPLLVFFSVTYGLFGIVYFSLMPVVIVDLLGIHNLPKTLGFVQLFQGVVVAVSHPIIGWLRDSTGHYHASYYYMSLVGLFCAFLLLFTPCVTRQANTSTPSQPV